MVVLLARLHLVGFLWGDVSLSNTLFRRDAGAFAAYLVDAETGELHDELSDGQREHDLTIARTNLYGEFCDLEAGGLLDESLDPLELVEAIENRYRELWAELTGVEEFDGSEMHRIEPGSAGSTPSASTSRSSTSPPTSPARRSGSSRRSSTPGTTPPAAPADRAGHRGEPGPAAAQRPGLLPGAHRPAGRRRGDRGAPVADRAVRAGGGTPCRRRCGQAGAGRALPRGARAPLVPERAGGRRGRHPRGRAGLHERRAAPAAGRGDRVSALESMGRAGQPVRPVEGFVDEDTTSRTTPGRTPTRVPARTRSRGAAYLDIAALRAKAKK